MSANLRTQDLKRIAEAFEKEHSKLLEQAQQLKGHSDRIEWVIKVLINQIDVIEKEEKQKLILQQQQLAALNASKEKGSIGSHPSERENPQDRKNTKKQNTSSEQK